MPRVPAAEPDGEKIRQLIKDRGYISIAQFARSRRRWEPSTIYHLCYGTQRGSMKLIGELAEVLGVAPEELVLSDDADAPSAA